MDFREIVNEVSRLVSENIAAILKKDLAPADKKGLIEALFQGTGRAFADKLYADVSEVFDSTAIKSIIDINYEQQIERLADKIVRDNAYALQDDAITKEYFDTLLARAENTAFKNAKSLDKHPTLTRMMTGFETCEWCRVRAGTYTDPDYELFARHDNCDCIFTVSGYNTRNGVLKNYKKKG